MTRPKRDDVAVKVDAAVYRRAKMIAAYRGVTLAEYISELLKQPVSRDYARMLKGMSGDADEAPAAD